MSEGNANERERLHQDIFICVIILKGDLKGFQENFENFSPAENSPRSRNQSDCRICRIPPAHELRKR